MDEPKPVLEPWPFKMSREEIAAAKARRDTARQMYGTRHPEYKKAAGLYMRSLQRLPKMREPKRPPSKLRADREWRLRQIAERGKDQVAQAEKAIESLYGLAAQGRSAILMRQFVKLAETYGPQIMEARLKDENPATRYKALSELMDLLKTCYRTEQDKEPKRQQEPRKVVVREWPAEGAKA